MISTKNNLLLIICALFAVNTVSASITESFTKFKNNCSEIVTNQKTKSCVGGVCCGLAYTTLNKYRKNDNSIRIDAGILLSSLTTCYLSGTLSHSNAQLQDLFVGSMFLTTTLANLAQKIFGTPSKN